MKKILLVLIIGFLLMLSLGSSSIPSKEIQSNVAVSESTSLGSSPGEYVWIMFCWDCYYMWYTECQTQPDWCCPYCCGYPSYSRGDECVYELYYDWQWTCYSNGHTGLCLCAENPYSWLSEYQGNCPTCMSPVYWTQLGGCQNE